ncbi:uncharacterized protein N7458_004668 [Penicillium daleae]|uniref:NAD-dependent epimerase/dehydratase domain-containing protein n=1 Tax=Penicillium daleae TaxID=63821 RepID=A0AAD6C991_9EURO|nr:uncharacterized protein N7458_004668 [Penicillium daleae]KAJ5453712.1 hypothetical protein N7458_004668 [Penicillium daleae]
MSASTILVTGVSGYIATHVAKSFISHGYRVRGTVRNQETAEKVRETFSQTPGCIEIVIVPDIAKKDAFNEAVRDVDGVVHTASPFFYKVSDFDKDMREPAVNGTLGLLKAVKSFNSKVKRVVITSSFVAMQDFSKGHRPGYIYTEKDWNPVDLDMAYKYPSLGYVASKTLAERAAWDFVRTERPNFTLATINPPMVYGPVAHTATLKSLNQSVLDIWQLMSGQAKKVPSTSVPLFVDVRDCAKAHVRAFESFNGGRFIPVSGSFSFKDICSILQEEFPEYADLVPNPGPPDASETFGIDNSLSKKELQMSFERSLRETIKDTARSLDQIAKRKVHPEKL